MRYSNSSIVLLLASTICLMQSGCWNSENANGAANLVEESGVESAVVSESGTADEENRAARLKVERLFESIKAGDTLAGAEDVALPLVGLKIIKPMPDMIVDGRNVGFLNEEKNISLKVAITPLPFDRQFRGQFMETLAAQEFLTHYTRDTSIDGQPAVYILGEETVTTPDGQGEEKRLKHVVGFGNDTYTWVVSGTMPLESEDELSESLLASILSARITGEIPQMIGNELSFSISKPDSLEFSNGWGRRYVLTKGGEFPLKSVQDCYVKFECPPSRLTVREEDRMTYASQFLKVAPTVEIHNVSTKNKVSVGGLDGYEFLAIGSEAMSGAPVFVYAGVLFDEDRVYTMTGWYGSIDESTDYLDDLKALFRSFKQQH